MKLLTLEESLNLDIETANKYYDLYLNRYLLQVFKIIGLGELDIVGAQGVEVWLRDGRKLLDFSAGIGVLGLGHNHPRILAAERRCHELKLIDCVRVGPHKIQAALAYNIAQCLPDPLNVSFLAVSGSEAVEAALKICERAQGPQKQKFICMEGSFHGKTHGALSITTAGRFQRGFLLGIPKEHVIDVPFGDAGAIERAIAAETNGSTNNIIAVIVEPVRGESAETPPDGYLAEVVKICRANNVLSIFDEVKVGMGRTGDFCAFMHERGVVPDVVTLAKTLGGGKREVGAMVTSQAIFDRAYGSKKDATLHSCSFGGMGESCAVAIETLNTIFEEDLVGRAKSLGAHFRSELERLQKKHPRSIAKLYGRGLFQAVQFNFQKGFADKFIDTSNSELFRNYEAVLISSIVRELYQRHNILTHFQPGALDTLHFMPPMVVEKDHLDQLINGLDDILTRGLADATLKFIGGNVARVLTFA